MGKDTITIKHKSKDDVEVDAGMQDSACYSCTDWVVAGTVMYREDQDLAGHITPMICYKVGNRWYCP